MTVRHPVDHFDGDPTGFPGQLNFVHKRLLGAVGGFVSGGPLGAVGGFFGGGGRAPAVGPPPPRAPSTPMLVPPPSVPGNFDVPPPAPPGFSSGSCVPGFTRGPSGICLATGSPGAVSVGAFTGVSSPGTSMVAQPGGLDGQLPSARSSTTLICPPGMVLSKDNRCFNHLARKDRKWNPGRKPLLTGGERNAITKAAGAARKIQRTEKQLQKLGMLKKPTARRAPRASHVHPTIHRGTITGHPVE